MANTSTDLIGGTDGIVPQLSALEQLTWTEARVARTRAQQARTDAVRAELRTKAEESARRGRRIADLIRTFDAVPGVVAPAIGRVLALVRNALEQVQPIDEALLADLALEHQLRDRARYVGAPAERAGLREVRELADELGTAHTATIEWLTTVLVEEARGDLPLLSPTPLQWLASGVTHAAGLPARFAVRQVDRAVHTVYRAGEQARTAVGQAGELATGSRQLAAAATGGGAELGGRSATELPIPHYVALSAPKAIAAIRALDTPRTCAPSSRSRRATRTAPG